MNAVVYKIVKPVKEGIFNAYSKTMFNMNRRSMQKYKLSCIEGENVLTKEQKAQLETFWTPYIKIAEHCHAFYTQKTGVFSVKYIPQDVWYLYIDRYYNNMDESKTLDNKCYYPFLFAGIKQPELIVRRMGRFWYEGDQIISEAALKARINAEPAAFIKEATESHSGYGVRYVSADNGDLYTAFCEAIAPMQGDIVVQKPVKQHAGLSALNESSVNTYRILTMMREDGITVYSRVLRMGIGNIKVDNASSGGVTCGIREDGTLRAVGYKPSGESYTVHPSSGVVFDGYQLPCFDKAVELVKKAHPMVPHFQLMAWDIAIDEKGEAVMIEANLTGGELDFHQLNNGPVFGDDTEQILAEVFGKK